MNASTAHKKCQLSRDFIAERSMIDNVMVQVLR
jgi:hypothetical protein